MKFEVLGPVSMRHGSDVVTFSGRIRHTLLALLLANANDQVSVDVILDTLWNESADSRHTQRLQVHVHKLRQLFDDPDRLVFSSGGYCLQVYPGELDAQRFETLVDEAGDVAEHDPQRCAGLLRQALDLWRGTPYQGVDHHALTGEVQRLTERRLVTLEELYAAELACDRHASVVGELTELVHRNPLRERFHALLMSALYRGGRQAEALDAYQTARRTMVDELGLEPGPELRVLEQQILNGEVIGPTHTRATAPLAAAPAQLPHNVPDFVGREADLAELDHLASGSERSTPVVTISGTAGVGKTALAVHWAHRAASAYPDGQLYIDLRGFGPDQPLTPDDALAECMRALGVTGRAIPSNLTERAARFRTLVDRKRMLLVLDNAATVEQVRPLLPGTTSCFVLITSRASLAGLAAREGAHRLDLARLSTSEARSLLGELLGERDDADATTQLIGQCAHLPLALRIAAERIRERRGGSIAQLVAELADEQSQLDILDAGADQQASVRAVFSWSYRQLPTDVAQLFRLMGLHPGHDIDLYALTALVGDDDVRATRRRLDILQRARLVDDSANSRYHLHDLLWAYAAELTQADDTPAERHAALSRLLDYYVHTAATAMEVLAPGELELRESFSPQPSVAPRLPDYATARQWLDAERTNLVLTAEWAADNGMATYTTDIATVLWRYLDVGVHLDDFARLNHRAYSVAVAERDLAAEGIALRSLGVLEFRTDRYDTAGDYLQRALAVHEQLGDEKRLATTLNYVAGLAHSNGRPEAAIEALERSLHIYEKIGAEALLTRALSNLGFLHRRRGDHVRAATALVRALSIASNHHNHVAFAHTLRHLGELYREMEEYDKAIDHAQETLKLAREGGITILEGSALNLLGTIYLQLGDHATALSHYLQALSESRSLGVVHIKAQSLNGLAETYAAMGATDDAIRYYGDALAVASAKGLLYEQARAHAGLGNAHAQQDAAHEVTREHWTKARDIYLQLGTPEAEQIQRKISS